MNRGKLPRTACRRYIYGCAGIPRVTRTLSAPVHQRLRCDHGCIAGIVAEEPSLDARNMFRRGDENQHPVRRVISSNHLDAETPRGRHRRRFLKLGRPRRGWHQHSKAERSLGEWFRIGSFRLNRLQDGRENEQCAHHPGRRAPRCRSGDIQANAVHHWISQDSVDTFPPWLMSCLELIPAHSAHTAVMPRSIVDCSSDDAT